MNLKRLFNCLFILSLFNFSLLFSLERIQTNEIITNQRDYSLAYYENETGISHWYGSETWAVKFVAEDFRPNVQSMTITSVRIYFPSIPDNTVNIRAFSYNEDSEFDPLFGQEVTELNYLNYSISESGWNEFTLSSPYTGPGLWIIVDNITNFSNNFMATATGSGHNSFFKIIDNGEVAFNSLYDINVQQELLYSVQGYLNLDYDIVADSIRVELQETSLKYSHDNLWEYNYKIRNYSEETLANAQLEIEIQHPDPEVYETNYTYVDLTLLPLSDTQGDEENPIYLELPIENSQYKITTNLLSHVDGYSMDNDMIKICNFQEDSDVAIIMNFLSSNYDSTIGLLANQREIAQDNWMIYNYGIDGSDQLFYSDYANSYYQSLGINLNPLTLINGTKYFNSFNLEALEENLLNNIYYIPRVFDISDEGLEEEGSSLIYYSYFNYGQRYVFETFTNNLAMDVFISQKTKHYSEEGDEFVVSQISDVYADFERLNEDGEGYFEFSYDTDSVDSLYTSENGQKFANAIIYRQDTNEIISFYRYTLENNILVSNHDNEVASATELLAYPNPVSTANYLNFISTSKKNISLIDIYNIRGQKVKSVKVKDNKIKLPGNMASGIYFIKAKYDNGEKSPLSKVLIMRSK